MAPRDSQTWLTKAWFKYRSWDNETQFWTATIGLIIAVVGLVLGVVGVMLPLAQSLADEPSEVTGTPPTLMNLVPFQSPNTQVHEILDRDVQSLRDAGTFSKDAHIASQVYTQADDLPPIDRNFLYLIVSDGLSEAGGREVLWDPDGVGGVSQFGGAQCLTLTALGRPPTENFPLYIVADETVTAPDRYVDGYQCLEMRNGVRIDLIVTGPSWPYEVDGVDIDLMPNDLSHVLNAAFSFYGL